MKHFARFAACVALAAAASQAQPTRAQMEAVTMPRASFHVTKTLA